MSLITIHNESLTVVVSTLGAELQSIKDANGVERLWQGNPAYWTGRAPILFPIAGGLRDDCYYLDGKRYEMPKHGYVRKLEWQAESSGADHAVFLVTEQHPGFPFRYELRACYALEGATLKVEYRVSNLDKQAFWFGMGSHEAFATPEGIEDYEIVFDEPERLEDYVLEGNLIRKEPVAMAESTNALPLKYGYFAVDALVFRTLKSRGVTLRSRSHARQIRVDFPEHDVLMLWTKPGAGYICIEPWLNAPDFVDSDMQIEHKQGCLCLQPGRSVCRQHSITVQ